MTCFEYIRNRVLLSVVKQDHACGCMSCLFSIQHSENEQLTLVHIKAIYGIMPGDYIPEPVLASELFYQPKEVK